MNNIQLMLYYAIGRYISANSRKGHWGTDAIGTISRLLRTDMPGLRGYSESNIKRMRSFFEEWIELDPLNGEPNSPIQTGDLSFAIDNIDNEIVTISPIQTGEIQTSPIPTNLTDEITILPLISQPLMLSLPMISAVSDSPITAIFWLNASRGSNVCFTFPFAPASI